MALSTYSGSLCTSLFSCQSCHQDHLWEEAKKVDTVLLAFMAPFLAPLFPSLLSFLPPLCPSVRPRPPLASPGRGGMSEADGRSEWSSLRSDKGASASRRGAILRKQVAARGPKEENDRLQSGRALNHYSCDTHVPSYGSISVHRRLL